MSLKALFSCAFFFTTLWTASALAWGPPAEIHTKDGSVFYGELVERVPDDHVTIMLATGVAKVVATKDIDPNRVPLTFRPDPDSQPAPIQIVRTKDGSLYRGELVEKVAHDHVTLKLETDEFKTIADADIDTSPPPSPRPVSHDPAPIETIRTTNGNIFHGEVVEKVIHDYVTLKLATGEVRTIGWRDIVDPSRLRQPSKNVHELHFDATPSTARLQRLVGEEFEDVCVGACTEIALPSGDYRVGGVGLAASRAFHLDTHATVFVEAKLHARRVRTSGSILGAASIPVLLTATVLSFVDAAQGAYTYTSTGFQTIDHTAFEVGTAFVWSAGLSLAVAGVILLLAAEPRIRVNGQRPFD